jgi:uncharacterized Tic20 family protein
MNWIIKIIAAIIVWVAVALLVAFVGSLIVTVDQEQIRALGTFLKENSGLLGFLAGAAFLIWGRLPARFA